MAVSSRCEPGGAKRVTMSKQSRGIQSIEVGGELLRALVRIGEPMMLRDLAREAGMAPAKAHPYLVSFSRIGLIEQNGITGRYEFGPLALDLGLISLRRISAVRVATSAIAALASRIDHAVSLAIWGTNGPTIIRLEEPSHPIHIAMRVGSVVALLGTATGRVFSAFLPPKVTKAALESGLDRLGVGYDSQRASRGPKIARSLAEVRARGLARAVEDPLPGISAFAAPVFDHTGAIALVVTAMGPVGAFDVSWNSAIGKALLDCTAEISRQLGFRAAAIQPGIFEKSGGRRSANAAKASRASGV
jgi:DNA-binding IclR family transcriptional regulator